MTRINGMDINKNAEKRVLEGADIRAGDVLLCSMCAADDRTVELRRRLGLYTHAAIALGGGTIVDANDSGVIRDSLTSLLESSRQIAVIRSKLWFKAEVEKLNEFTGLLIEKNAGFNHRGLVGFEAAKRRYDRNVMSRLEKYILNDLPEESFIRRAYFCSELVVAAFADVGIIGPKASQVLRPEVHTPPDLGRDRIFGDLCGVLVREGEVPFASPFDRQLQPSVKLKT